MKGSIHCFFGFLFFFSFFPPVLPLLFLFLFVSGLVTMSGGESSAVPIQHHSSHMSNSQSRCWGTKISISSVPSSPLSAALSHPLSLCISVRAPSLINGCGSWRLGGWWGGAKAKKKWHVFKDELFEIWKHGGLPLSSCLSSVTDQARVDEDNVNGKRIALMWHFSRTIMAPQSTVIVGTLNIKPIYAKLFIYVGKKNWFREICHLRQIPICLPTFKDFWKKITQWSSTLKLNFHKSPPRLIDPGLILSAPPTASHPLTLPWRTECRPRLYELFSLGFTRRNIIFWLLHLLFSVWT